MMSQKKLALSLLMFPLMALLLGAGDDAHFDKLGHKMICPCGCNQILLECNHVGCTYSDRMRGELVAALQRGDSDDLVLQAFVQKYGATVLAAPTTTGFNAVAWVTPFAVFAAALFLATVVISRWKKCAVVATGTTSVSAISLDQFREQARRETEL